MRPSPRSAHGRLTSSCSPRPRTAAIGGRSRLSAILAPCTATICSCFGAPAGELTTADRTPAWPPLLRLENAARERRLLGALADAAARAARHESKIGALGRLLRRVNEPAIVFTEYRDTLMHVQAALGLS